MPDAKERQEKVRKDLETIRKHADFLQNHAGATGTGLRGVFTFDATHPAIQNTISNLSADIAAHQGPGGPIPLVPAKLSEDKLKNLVDYKRGGAGIGSNTLPDFTRPMVQANAAEVCYAAHGNQFRGQVDNLIQITNDTLAEIERNATENVNKLISPAANTPRVTEEEWAGGFQGPLKRLEIRINAKIEEIKTALPPGPNAGAAYAPDEFKINTLAQIESLEKMKKECRAQVEKLQDEALLKTIKEAKFDDGTLAGGANLMAGQEQLNGGLTATLAKHARLARQAQLQGYTDVKKKGLFRDTRVSHDPSEGFQSGQTYEAKFSKWWIFTLKSTPFSISTVDGKDVYRFKIGGNTEDLERILDAFFAGKEEGTSNFRGQGKINLPHLQALATIAHNHVPPYKINLGPSIIENLRKKHKMDDAEILRLGKQLGGPDWELPSTAPKQRA